MVNFNTNQTRFLYVAGAIDSNVDTNLDIALVQAATGEMFFKYKNADGLLTRSDSFDPKKIVSLKKTTASELALPLQIVGFTVDTSAVTLSDLIGKTVTATITVHQAISYDDSDSYSFVAAVVGNSTNTGSVAAFLKAMAKAIITAVPKTYANCFSVYMVKSGTATLIEKSTADASYMADATGIVLVPKLQKHVVGKQQVDPTPLSIAYGIHGSEAYEGVVWGSPLAYNTVAALNSGLSVSISPAAISGAYALADLEYFAAGEKGDYYRGSFWPNDYPFTPAIDIAKSYNVLSIEYYWAGGAENVQKSPRLIQVVAEAKLSDDVVTSLYNTINSVINKAAQLDAQINTATTGLAAQVDSLDTRVTALEG